MFAPLSLLLAAVVGAGAAPAVPATPVVPVSPASPAIAASPASPATLKPAVVTVHATEFALRAPKSVPAGTITFRMLNEGKMMHHVAIVRLLHGKTLADYMAALRKPGPPPTWAVDVGGPNAAAPGQSSQATMTLEPGQYALLCFVPSPGDPAPHLMKGMATSLTVVPSSAPSAEPSADVNVRLSDYAFTMSKPLVAGHHVIRVTNDAAQSHEIVIVKLPPNQTAAHLASWVESGMQGPPPGMPLGGTTQLAKGRAVEFPVDLTAGTYGMICFVPDAKDGKPHSAHGMTTQFVVK
jgi:uncharacterized cupredoxin-like copper-binding protein